MKNKKSLFYRPTIAKQVLCVLLPVALAQSALGKMTILFVEEEAGVRISFSGKLALDPATFTNAGEVDRMGAAGVIGAVDPTGVGSANRSLPYNHIDGALVRNIDPFPFPDTAASDGGQGSLVFSGDLIGYDISAISGGSPFLNVSELTAIPERHYFFLPGATLASINGTDTSIAEGAILWTAKGTNDTVVFSRRAAPILVGDSVKAVGFAGSGRATVIDPGVEFSFTAGNGQVDAIDLNNTSGIFTVSAPPGEVGYQFFGRAGGDVFTFSDLNFSPSQDVITFSIADAVSNGVTASDLQAVYDPICKSYVVSFAMSGEMTDVTQVAQWKVEFTNNSTPLPQPFLYLPLNGDTLDVSGNDHNGFASAGLTFGAGVAGEAAVFTGSEKIDFDDFFINASDYTFTGFYSTDSTGGAIIGLGAGLGTIAALQLSSTLLRFIDRPAGGNGGGISVFSPVGYSDGAFHHFAIRKSGTNSGIFVDGVLVAEGIGTAGTFNGITDLVIGQNSPDSATRYFTGSLDEIRLYDSALTDSQIADLAQNLSFVVQNHSAEDPGLNPAGEYTLDNPGWSELSNAGDYTGIVTGGWLQHPPAPDGNQWLFLDSRSKEGLYQKVGTISANTSYTLDLVLGTADFGVFPLPTDFRFGIFAGRDAQPESPLAVANQAYVTAGSRSTQEFSLTFTALPGSPFIGQSLFISMEILSVDAFAHQVYFDDITFRSGPPVEPFFITDFNYNVASNTVDLTFQSVDCFNYSIDISPDGRTWKPTGTPIPGSESAATTTVTGFALPAPAPDRLLLRVRRTP